MFLQIALLSTPYSLLTYESLEEFPDSLWKPGLRLAIPLGRSKTYRCGILIAASDNNPLPKNVAIRKIVWPLELVPILTNELVQLVLEMSKRQGENIGRMAAGFLPQGLRNLSELVHTLDEKGSHFHSIQDIAVAGAPFRKQWALQLMEGTAKFISKKRDADTEERYALNCDPPWPVRPNAKLQIQVLEYLYTHGSTNRKILRASLGQAALSAAKALCGASYVTICRDADALPDADDADTAGLLPPTDPPFTLNKEQEQALDHLQTLFGNNARSETCLLYGVTGSGKTAVYLEMATFCLRENKSVFLLVPEVALALKILNDTKNLYPSLPVFLYHGYQSQTYRESLWRHLEKKEAVFVIGTRSALFLPARNLGCIILDEEHDGSFKQDDGLCYHAKEIAWFRAQYSRAILILGSATPDIRTFYAAQEHHIDTVCLKKRVSGNTLPPIELVDLRERNCMSESVSLLAKKSIQILQETINRGEQAVIVLNRRGYSPHIYCLECGKTERCPDCEIGLTYHKARGKLVCHFCGYTRDFPSPCSSCGGATFLPLGEGTERITEELSSYLGQRVLRLDRDTTSRPGQMEEILAAFAAQKGMVLVGTQMLSKGHHFPLVTLVIAANADMGLSIPDYRATERTFQLLLQSAGRAGRGEKPGRVLLQTRDPEHFCWPYVLSYDYESFYAAELSRRKKHFYPPFCNLALIRISFPREEEAGMTEVTLLAQAFRSAARLAGVVFLGPAPSPHAMLCARKRYQCLLKADSWGKIREVFSSGMQQVKTKVVRTTLDLDPVNML